MYVDICGSELDEYSILLYIKILHSQQCVVRKEIYSIQ